MQAVTAHHDDNRIVKLSVHTIVNEFGTYGEAPGRISTGPGICHLVVKLLDKVTCFAIWLISIQPSPVSYFRVNPK